MSKKIGNKVGDVLRSFLKDSNDDEMSTYVHLYDTSIDGIFCLAFYHDLSKYLLIFSFSELPSHRGVKCFINSLFQHPENDVKRVIITNYEF